MNKCIVIWVVIFLLMACKNNPNDVELAESDSAQAAHDMAENDSLLLYKNEGTQWLAVNLKLKNTSWSNLQLENSWNEDTLDLQPFTPTKEFYNDYSSLLHWSPDSSYIIDMGSYGTIVVKDKNGKPTLEGGEPDTEISLIFPRQNQKARIMFGGPSSYFIDAQWIDNTQAMIVGTFDKEDQKQDTLLWMIDVKDKLFRLYNFKQKR